MAVYVAIGKETVYMLVQLPSITALPGNQVETRMVQSTGTAEKLFAGIFMGNGVLSGALSTKQMFYKKILFSPQPSALYRRVVGAL